MNKEEAVSEFITMTCEVHPQPNSNKYIGLVFERAEIYYTGTLSGKHSGSTSEFYIDPMLPCIGDFDVMIHSTNELVVPEGHHVTKYIQLPAEFHSSDHIVLREYVDSQFLGYVFIRFIGTFNKCRECYEFVPATEEYEYTSYERMNHEGMERHEPAITDTLDNESQEHINARFS